MYQVEEDEYSAQTNHKMAGYEKEGYILVGGNDRNINIYSIKTGEHDETLIGHKDSVTCMAMEGKLLFTGSDDNTIIIWNMVKVGG